jgi:putative ABC transport system permease protein
VSPFELFTLVMENLGRRKGRVALTAVGVIIGTAAVVILVSLAVGLQMDAQNRLGGIGDLRQIDVYPGFGDQEPGRVEIGPDGMPVGMQIINDDTIDQISAIPGVEAVIPWDWSQVSSFLRYNGLEGYGGFVGVGTSDIADLGRAVDQGVTQMERGEIIIGPMVSGNFYNPRQRPEDETPPPPDLMGQTLALVRIKWDPNTGVETRKVVQVKVVGILESNGRTDWDMYMRLDELTAYNEWAMGRRVNRARDGYPQAVVRVENIDDAVEVRDAIIALGYQAQTPQEFVQGINSFFVVLQVIFGGVGAIALLVAAIGIANTMAMAILERTREIGLMKAVGATNRDVLSVFLGEAAGIGALGGIGGVVVGWSLGQVINVLALSYLAGQAVQTGGPPPTIAVFTPVWLPIFALVFATIMGLLSGLYPALRAATLIPVTALKYE